MKSFKLVFLTVVLVLLISPGLQAQTSEINLYVNATTGKDIPTGRPVAVRPLKTIGYALQSLSEMRSSSDVQAVINIVAGTYNESITLAQNNIWLKGAGSGVTSVVGDGTSNVVQITGPIKSHVTGLTITNGGEGLYCIFASVAVENCVIMDNAGYAGIDVLNEGGR